MKKENDWFSLYHKPMKDTDYEYYFSTCLKSRSGFASNFRKILEKINNIEQKKMISIGCGVAAEESVFGDLFLKMVLVDQSVAQMNFIKKKYGEIYKKNNVEFIKQNIVDYITEEKFDIVYSSSCSSWMYDTALGKVDEDCKNFLMNHVSDDGLLVLRFYSRIWNSSEMKTEEFKEEFRENIKKCGFDNVKYYYSDYACLVLASKKDWGVLFDELGAIP